MNRQTQQQIQSNVLNGTTTVIVLYLAITQPELFNPWGLKLWQWILGAAIIRAAVTFYDHLVIYLLDHVLQSPLLPTRTILHQPVRYVTLDTQSIVFLTINAIHEWIFAQRFGYFLYYSPHVLKEWTDINVWNTIGGLWIIFIVMDILYAPCHHILHMPFIYPLIHKHHHRQHYPTRGYLDAGNEHPLEHLIGVLCVWGACLAAVHGPTKCHAITLFFFFNIHATLAMLNHSPYNVSFDIIPFGIVRYSVGSHEMHHRKFTVNYAQYCLWYDHVMNTFAPYEGPNIDVYKKQ